MAFRLLPQLGSPPQPRKLIRRVHGKGNLRPASIFILRRAPRCRSSHALLQVGDRVFQCSVGSAGFTARKKEGDRATPLGRLRVLSGFHAGRRPVTGASWLAATPPKLGWCDQPADRNYNRPVVTPYPASYEEMRRSDGRYDICIVLDWNMTRRRRNGGSAIFLHLTDLQRSPTRGCIALPPKQMNRLLQWLKQGDIIHSAS